MPPFRLGTVSHAKGYVLNKLFERHRIGESHLPMRFLEEGYPVKWRPLIKEAIQSLRSEGLILTLKKRTGRDSSLHACIVTKRLTDCRPLINAYRQSVDLGPVGKDMRTILPVE